MLAKCELISGSNQKYYYEKLGTFWTPPRGIGFFTEYSDLECTKPTEYQADLKFFTFNLNFAYLDIKLGEHYV